MFDGEGCVGIYTHNGRVLYPRSNPGYILRATISNGNPTPLLVLKEELGGSLSWQKRKDRRRHVCTWLATSLKAEKFLKLIFPYLIIKRDEAKVAFAFREFQRSRRKDRRQYEPYPPEIIGAFEGYRVELQYLKKIDYYKNQSLMKN